MTAFLKKRALAEFSTVVEQGPEPSWKRFKVFSAHLKTNDRPRNTDYFDLLGNCKNSNEALQVLLNTSESLKVTSEDVKHILKKFGDYFNQQSDSVVRAMILSLFSKLDYLPHPDIEVIVKYVVQLVSKETSHKVIVQGLSTLLALSKILPPSSVVTNNVLSLAKSCLIDTDPHVKIRCLQLLGHIHDNNTGIDQVVAYVFSCEARVRCAALETLILLIEKGHQLDVSLYSKVSSVINDDYDNVREVALKVISAISVLYPDYEVNDSQCTLKIRLIDDAFSKICQAVYDPSMNVRYIAVKLLGTMLSVGWQLLIQTLDKKLMSNMRRKESFHQMSRKIVNSGDWSVGKKWTNDKPLELLNKDDINFKSRGVCGAFVHGLEDDFMEVRLASIDSLCKLALARPKFSFHCLDYLVDMLSDEIEAVRLISIQSLTSLASHITLREHQLDIILGALEDFSFEMREGIHKVLASCRFASSECLQMCIDYLLDNLKKYPQDRNSTWLCAQGMGSRNSDLILPLTADLLDIHTFFDITPQDIESPTYITLLLFIFNAAQNCPTMISLFNENVFNHYSYLRTILPSFVPELELPIFVDNIKSIPGDSIQYLWKLVDIFSRVPHEMIDTFVPQLEKLKMNDNTIAGPTHYIILFISCQTLLNKILINSVWSSNAISKIQYEVVNNDLKELSTMLLKLQALFVGLTIEEIAGIKQIQLIFLSVHFVLVLKRKDHSSAAFDENLIYEFQNIRNFFVANNVISNSFCQQMLAVTEDIGNSPNCKSHLVKSFLDLLRNVAIPYPLKPSTTIQMCHGSLEGPMTSLDCPVKLSPNFPTGVKLEAMIFSLANPKALRFRIHYPNDETHVYPLNNSDIQYLNGGRDCRIISTVLLTCYNSWSDVCYAKISLCINLPDMADLTYTYGLDPLLEVCNPFKIYLRCK